MSENVIQDKLELDISNFLDSIKKATSGADELSDSVEDIKEQLQSIREQTSAIDDFKNKLKEAINGSNEEIKRLKENLKGAQADFRINPSDANENALKQAWAELEKEQEKKEELLALDKKLNAEKQALLEKQRELNNLLKEQKDEEKGKGGFSFGLKDALKDAKRFTLALFGIRGVYTAIRRLAGENQEMTNTTTAMWKALGKALEPLFNSIAKIVQKIIGYFASLIYYISGVNILDKALKSGAQSAKSIKNSLAGFDEINNIGGGGGSGADTGWMNTLKDIKIDTSWVEFLDALTGAPTFMKDLIGYFKDPSVDNFFKLLENIGGALTTIGLILVALNVSNPFGWILIGVGLIAKCIQEIGGLGEFIKIIAEGIGGVIKRVGEEFERAKTQVFDGIVNTVNYVLENVKKIADGIKMIFNGNWRDGIRSILSGAFNILDKIFPNIKTGAKQLAQGIKDLFNGNWKSAIVNIFKGLGNAVISIFNSLIKGINAMASPIRALIVAIGKVLGKSWTIDNIKIPTIPALATGTNYVPADGLAYLHQGEAVIPKRFNDKEYFGSGNEETNQLLSNILTIVSNMDMNPQVAVSDIVKGINKQSRVKGVSVV